jgi:hypothetical protein
MSDQSFERAVGTWLESGSDRTPPAAIDAVLLAVKTTPQERDLRIPRRFITMPTYMRLAAVIAIVAVVGVGALMYSNREPGIGGQPTPSPTPVESPTESPTPSPTVSLLDTSAWVPYASIRYGFSISRPVDWTEDPAQREWSFETDFEPWKHLEATDHFSNASGDVGVSAWSTTVPAGTTVEAWMEQYCTAQNAGPCTDIHADAVDVLTGDQHPGRLVFGRESDAMAFILDGQTMYIVAVWRGETDPAVRPYGGARALLEAFVSTMTLPAEPPQGSPAASPDA